MPLLILLRSQVHLLYSTTYLANAPLRELTPYPHFVAWKNEQIDGHYKKPPFNPKTHYPASVDNPSTWGTLNQALNALATGNFNGIGFVFSKDDPFTGIDLDNCVGDNRSIDKWAKLIIEHMNTYTEYSPRGQGIRMFVEGTTIGGKFGNIELYDNKHYMTITTRHVSDTETSIESRQEELATLYNKLVPQFHQTQVNTRGGVAMPPKPTQPEQREPIAAEKPDEQVIKEALQEERSNFVRYWNADISLWTPTAPGEKPERNSPSEVFFVLLAMLLTRTGDNEEQVKRLYWQSPFAATYPKASLFIGRDKDTGRPVTYLESTIKRVIEKRNNPPPRR